jgi:sulfatase modifying factor 1
LGAVAETYQIGKTEVTIGQYAEFLNAVAATDTYSLYNANMGTNPNVRGITQLGSPGSYTYTIFGSANRPITYISWGDAARFANWMHNNQPTGAQNASTTEAGAYPLNGAISNAALNAVTRNPGAKWFLPTEDEWFKAAFHKNDGVTGNYWDYATSTDAQPNSDQPPGDISIQTNVGNFRFDDSLANGINDGYAVTGSTVYSGALNYLTDAGAYTMSPSPYGTFDQAGNVREWNETLISSARGFRGGSWDVSLSALISTSQGSDNPENEIAFRGFRLAASPVPEPSTYLLGAFGGLLWLVRKQYYPATA